MKGDLLNTVRELLEQAGFSVIECNGLRSCFDILAKREDNIILIKTLANIEGFSKVVAEELKSTSSVLGAHPLVVGSHMKSHPLEGNVVYDRYGLMVLSPAALESLIEGKIPSIYAKRGKYCVNIDSNKLVDLRESRNLTQNDLAKLLGVASHSVYRYERSGRMSFKVYEKLKEIFLEGFLQEDELISPIKYTIEIPLSRKVTEIKSGVKEEFENFGFETFFTNAPFDVIAKKKETVYTVVSNDYRRIEKKLQTVEEFSDLLGGYSVCISNRKVKSDSIVIGLDELKNIKSAKELYQLLRGG